MFGMGFGELAVVVIVGLVIFGPKELPKVLRKLGQWAGKMRRMAADLRAQSGIDDALASEGLTEPIREIQKLTRGELDGVMRSVRSGPAAAPAAAEPAPVVAYEQSREPEFDVLRDREYPVIGCDACGALPDDAVVYRETLPASAYARDPIWNAGAPPPEEPAPSEEPAADAPAEEPAPSEEAAPSEEPTPSEESAPSEPAPEEEPPAAQEKVA